MKSLLNKMTTLDEKSMQAIKGGRPGRIKYSAWDENLGIWIIEYYEDEE